MRADFPEFEEANHSLLQSRHQRNKANRSSHMKRARFSQVRQSQRLHLSDEGE